MKKFFIFLSIFAVAASFKSFDTLPIGSLIPKANLKLKDVSGKEIMLNDAKKENGLLVMFSCNTCPVVIANQARTKEVCQFATDKKVGVIILNANEGDRDDGNSFAAMQSYAHQQNYNWFYAIDKNSEVADAFGANKTPESFLFDKNGKLVYHGAIDDSPGNANGVKRHHLKEALNELIAGKSITVSETRSVGCSINRR
jgi:thioredoxin-related protein